MKRAIFIFFAIAITGLLIWTLIYLYGKSQEKPVTFNTETGVYTDIIQKTVATGSVLPRKEIEIKPVVSGIVDQLYIEPGQLVKEGDLLARVKVIPDMVTLNNAENRLERAEIAMDDAKLDFDRNKGLFDKGVISYADYQPFDLARRNAKSEMSAAEDNLKIIRDGVSKKNSSAANTLVRSTISGMVLAVPIEVGNSVIEVNNFNEGTSIATIADMTDLIFIGNVDESEVGKIREGMELILTIGAIENESFKAILEYISPKGIEENGAIQFEIKAAVDLLDNQFIRAGYSANADVVLARRDSVLAINEGLIQYEGDTATFVEVKNGTGYERRAIQTGLSDGIFIEVLSGVAVDDEIKIWNKPITE
jgi:HlyD family secretion protein